ncbi:alpha-2-macroglobulin family protein [Poritiphilus flavus]|uniref:TonB-dependent receptor plug domain-containing protein n=1 Tax=Poritiphilus flavus TaxID=2697053 RepID=A0A6L9EA65_9FLAO|nr:carboxypeptidase-like regulatory domain-containing protein [Poritiphilus flavus]NAS11438.1 TonB-dependent receptor plug domain-containing protein [Poritiphilus flavus]
MKKAILLMLLALGFQCVYAQTKYEKLWKEVEQFELEGKFKSASEVVDKILQKSDRSNDSDQIVKSFIYKSKFALLLEENAQKSIVKEIQEQIKASEFPTDALLKSVYAGFFEQYLAHNRYKISTRTETLNSDQTDDFEKWDLNTLVTFIADQHQEALQHSNRLKDISIEKFKAILTESNTSKKYRPTLYDFLMHRALTFHKIDRWYVNRPSERFFLTDPVIFESTEKFVEEPFVTVDSVFSNQKALKLYQRLESFHKNQDTTAYIDVVIQRLKFSRDQSSLGDKDQLYLNRLELLLENYDGHPISGVIAYEIAEQLFKASNISNAKSNPQSAELRIKAHNICKEVIDKYPNSDGGLLCKILTNKIERQELDIEIEKNIVPNKPFLGRVSFKNIDSLYISIYSVPNAFMEGAYYYQHDSLALDVISSKKAAASMFYNLQQRKDFYSHSTEIDFPELSEGAYLIVASSLEAPKTLNEIYAYEKAQVTNLVLLSSLTDQRLNLKLLHRSNGNPISGAKITLRDDKDYLQVGETDAKGTFSVKRQKKESYNLKASVTKGNDSIANQGLWLGAKNGYDYYEDNHMAKMSLFLDRSIYRPGQTLYFKGIVTETKKGKTKVVPNVWVTLMVYDTNYEELKEIRLRTNEYGSVHGQYEIPRNTLTGEFTIEMDEDYGTEEDNEDPYWYKIDDFEMAEVSFSVEEYKRPRFEVTFEEVKENLLVGDSVLVNGNAEALLGTAIKNATVKYTVERNTTSLRGSLYYQGKPRVVAQGEIKTTEKGDFKIPFLSVPDSTITPNHKPIYTYSVNAEVTDINGETRSAETVVRVGYHNLEARLKIASALNRNETNSAGIKTQNLNHQPIPALVEIQIFKLREPTTVFRKKPWSLVEAHIIEKSEYRRLFPNEPYDSLDLKQHWPKGEMVLKKQMQTNGEDKIALGDMKQWQIGAYTMVLSAIDNLKDTVKVERRFDVYDTNESSIPSTQLFDYKIINSAYKRDGFVHLQFSTAAEEVKFFLEGYCNDKEVYKEEIDIKKGISSIKIPVREHYKDQMVFNAYFVKFNSFYSKQFAVDFPQVTKGLSIETISFRNKLVPDSNETWSFKITNSDNQHAEAEVLASMYDASLDQFRKHEWNQQLEWANYYSPYAPRIEDRNSFRTTNFRKFNYALRTNVLSFLKNYHQLNWFGLDFGSTKSDNNRYLQKLKNKTYEPPRAEGNISGIVTDPDGIPLPGVNVMVNGTTLGTQTDFDGYYSINAPIGSELIFSYLGFLNDMAPVPPSAAVNMVLTEDAQALDEVVITGYGVVRKQDLTAAVYANAVSVRNDIENKLSGKAAGVQITHTAGSAGSGTEVVIRGISSLNSKNRPLFIIDGVIVDFADGELNEIILQTSDIEDISVLKDSAATAIYGSRGANGVVILTTKKGLEKALQVETRTNLKETAFFLPSLRTDSNGTININFNSPQALTKWHFMMLAHTKDLELGSLAKTAITQKDLSIVPNYPRFLREKDSLVFSAKISNLTSDPQTGTAILQLFDPVTMEHLDAGVFNSDQSQNFSIAPNNDLNVSWKFYIPENINAVQFKVLAKSGNKSDGESVIIPVLSNRILITESKPVWVLPNNTKEVVLEKLKTQNSNSLRHHRFTLEYTSNPAWLAIRSLPYLIEFPHACAEQTFSRLYANAVAEHIMKSNPKIAEVFQSWANSGHKASTLEKNEELQSILIAETPWVRDSKNEIENQARLGKLFEKNAVADQQLQALVKLRELQLASGVFPWFAGGRANSFITRHIVAGFGHLNKMNIQSENEQKSKTIIDKALKYLDQEFIKRHQKALKNTLRSTKITLTNSDIHYLYSRSFFLESHPLSKELKTIHIKYLKLCKENWLAKSLYNKAMISLILARYGNKEDSKKIMDGLEEQAVQSEENGIYWKENTAGWYWFQAPIETQALLIEAFTEIGADKKTIDGLKLWLLKNKRTHQWNTTKATTEAIYALLLQGSDWLSVSENTVISIGNQKIQTKKLEPTKKEAGTGYMKINWSEDEITDEMATIKIQNKSKVSGFGGVYWQYFEDLDRLQDSKNGPLTISKRLFLKEKSLEGDRLIPINEGSGLGLGDLITVRLEISSKEDLEFVHLKDLRASGLEPLDVISTYKWQDGLGYYQSTKDVATHFFFDNLPKGTYVLEYDLRANNGGNFSTGVSTLQSMYAPEFSGNSKGERLTIE